MAKILIVEDDLDLVETYTDLLEAHNHTVTSTGYARLAIELVIRVKPDVVIFDLNLAGHSGTIVINMIRSYQPLKDSKIVIVTGHADMLEKQPDTLRADLILHKPVSNEELLEVINRFTYLTAA